MLKTLLLQPRFQPGSTTTALAPDTPSEAYHSSQFDHFSSREVDYLRLCILATFSGGNGSKIALTGSGTASTIHSVMHATLGETSPSNDQREVNTQSHAQVGSSSATPGTGAAESTAASTHKRDSDQLVQHLNKGYTLQEEEFKWYLGIRVIRDRPNRKIWLTQDTYIDKVAVKFGQNGGAIPSLPIPNVTLVKREDQAHPREIKAYQERVGSILYAAITTRPDIAKAACSLSRFLTNPSSHHMKLANQCIRYLYHIRYLAIQYDGNNKDVVIASDASFADDRETRRSAILTRYTIAQDSQVRRFHELDTV